MTVGFVKGDTFRMPYEGGVREYTFVKHVAGGPLIFVDGTTGKPVPFDQKAFLKLVRENIAVRQSPSTWLERMDIHALMDAAAPNTPAEVRRKILAAQEKVAEAAMLLFYVIRFDAAAEGSIPRSADGYTRFIEQNYPAAIASRHLQKPSYSALRRALQKGVPHERRLADLISKRGNHSKKTWNDPWVISNLSQAVEEYYSPGEPKPLQLQDVVTRFLGNAIIEDRGRQSRGEPALKYPRRTAVEKHIREQETRERLANREPLKALREYGGRRDGASAEFPLQHVQVDQTQIDTWINIYDEYGNIEDRKRPFLVSIIDVYSRMILAAILTFHHPSTLTVQLAIKQMLRPKLFLVERFGTLKGATDGWGLPKEMTFDNGVENPGFSMRALLGDAGVDMQIAPKGTPQAKAIVERGFHTYNTGLWHSAPGGIPYKPHSIEGRRLTPEEKATWALDFATGVMWHWIVNVHHFARNRSLGAVPVRLWAEKVNDPMVGRSMFKRMDLLDIVCGTRMRLKINGSGVLYDTHVFHHPKVTEDILRATLPKESRSRRGRYGKVSIEAIVYEQCSHITIVDQVRNRFVVLPNTKPRFAEGLTYAEAKMIRSSDRRLDQQFITEEEMLLAKHEFLKLRDAARETARAKRAIAQEVISRRKAEERDELVVYTLADGDHVERGLIDPSVRGDAQYEVPNEMPAKERRNALISHKDQPRGVQKARTTREINRRIKAFEEEAERPRAASPPPTESSPEEAMPKINDPAGFLALLASDLD